MLCRNRKAIERGVLGYLILAIVGFIVVVMVFKSFIDRGDSAAIENACRTSIYARANAVLRLKVAGVEARTPVLFPVTCKTQHKTLRGDKAKIMEEIADMSAKCWWMFLNGEYANLFDEFNLLGYDKCFTCYSFYIQEKDIKITSEELFFYMAQKNYLEDGDFGVTYLDYIQSYRGDGALLVPEHLTFKGGQTNIYHISLLSPDPGIFDKVQNFFTWDEDKIGARRMNMVIIGQYGMDEKEYEKLSQESDDIKLIEFMKSCVEVDSI